MKMIKIFQRMRQREIAKVLGTTRHVVQVTQQEKDGIGTILDLKKTLLDL